MGRKRGKQPQSKASNPNEVFVVYGLVEPLTHEVFYVGVTNNLRLRYSAHIQDANGHKSDRSDKKKAEMLTRILATGAFPGVIVLEVTTAEFAFEKERLWQTLLDQRGIRLTNARISKPTPADSAMAYGLNVQLMTAAEFAERQLRECGHSAMADVIADTLRDVAVAFKLPGSDARVFIGRQQAIDKAMADDAA
jgi:hypothetical protein